LVERVVDARGGQAVAPTSWTTFTRWRWQYLPLAIDQRPCLL
jgi:hypothetical protein